MAAASSIGKRLPGLWGLATALALHGALVAALSRLPPGSQDRRPEALVEMEVVEPPPPPPLPEPEPAEPESPPPPPKPRQKLRSPPPVPEEPPPARTAPEPAEPAPPAFGVTLDSVVEGPSDVAVPVGNTLSTPERKVAPTPPAPVSAAPGPPSFSPVADSYIGEHPRVVEEVKTEQPSEARRLRMEGKVVMRVGIDRRGMVRSVRVIKKAGYGMDEAATQAMWKFKFTPARARDGQPVDVVITYNYLFRNEG